MVENTAQASGGRSYGVTTCCILPTFLAKRTGIARDRMRYMLRKRLGCIRLQRTDLFGLSFAYKSGGEGTPWCQFSRRA